MANRQGRPRKPGNRATRPDRYRGQPIAPFIAGAQPDLPDDYSWTDSTVHWWEQWGESHYAPYLSAIDWELLKDAALLHHAVWSLGELKFSGELRIKQNNIRETAEERMIADNGVRAVRPDGQQIVEAEVVEPLAIEADRQKVSQEHWDLMNRTIPERLLHERFEVES